MPLIAEIKKEILDKTDIDIHEKMCLICLMCMEGTVMTGDLAVAMGVTENTAKMAFHSLKSKGYFAQMDLEEDQKQQQVEALRKLLKRDPMPQNPIIKESDLGAGTASAPQLPKRAAGPEGEIAGAEVFDNSDLSPSANPQSARNPGDRFKNTPEVQDIQASSAPQSARKPEKLAKPVRKKTQTDDTDKVMGLLDEYLTRSEASIILGFAGGDYKKVEAAYGMIRGTQISDKVDALVNLLQTKEESTFRDKARLMAYKNSSKK